MLLWRLFLRRRRIFMVAFVPLAAVITMTAGTRNPTGGGYLASASATIAEPFQSGAAATFSVFAGFWERLFSGGRLLRENEELRLEVERLRREVHENRERVAAAGRIEALIEYRGQAGFRTAVAGVIGHDASGLYRTILIDRGERDGLRHNLPVLTPDGVVGRIIKIFPRSALVLLLTDRSSGIDAIVQRTRDQGVVQGRGGEACELKYLARQAEVEVGDMIVTSGMGGGFPKGIRIGQVSRVQKGGYLFQSVEVRPTAALDRLEEVLVVMGNSEETR